MTAAAKLQLTGSPFSKTSILCSSRNSRFNIILKIQVNTPCLGRDSANAAAATAAATIHRELHNFLLQSASVLSTGTATTTATTTVTTTTTLTLNSYNLTLTLTLSCRRTLNVTKQDGYIHFMSLYPLLERHPPLWRVSDHAFLLM